MKRRMNNIFREDGKAFLVAMDHGTGVNVLPELGDPGKVVRQCREGGADGFLMPVGMAGRFQKEIGDSTLLLRMDGGTSDLNVNGAPFELLVNIEDAIRLGADGVVCMGFPGSSSEEAYYRIIARLVSDGLKWNVPVGVETLPRGFEFNKFDDCRTPENIKLAARIGCEMGADFIKTPYTGDQKSFTELIEGCYRPVLILGGGKREVQGLLQEIHDAMECGAAGAIVGRNIYRYESPTRICKAVAAIVHKNASVEQAMAYLK